MKLNRRSMFGLIGGGALSGRRMAQQAAAHLSGLSVGHSGGAGELKHILRDNINLNPVAEIIDWQQAQHDTIAWALKQPSHRADLEAILYQQNRHIHTLDPDLAYNNCYSMAAKICYQRKRLVDREIEGVMGNGEGIYQQVDNWKQSIFTAQGLFKRFKNWLNSNQSADSCGKAGPTQGQRIA